MSSINAKNLVKQYGRDVLAVKDISFQVKSGEFISVMGESGSGKSTLLTMLGAMNSPTSGELFVDDIDVYNLNQEQLADFRREFLGFVFQSFHLVPYLTLLENVMLPLVTLDISKREKRKMSSNALGHVGLGGKYNRLPDQISGGEKERVAVARAIVNEPPILLADEPTGNLDSKTSHEVMKLLQGLNREGMTIVMVTHSNECAGYAQRTISLSDGQLIGDNGISGDGLSFMKSRIVEHV